MFGFEIGQLAYVVGTEAVAWNRGWAVEKTDCGIARHRLSSDLSTEATQGGRPRGHDGTVNFLADTAWLFCRGMREDGCVIRSSTNGHIRACRQISHSRGMMRCRKPSGRNHEVNGYPLRFLSWRFLRRLSSPRKFALCVWEVGARALLFFRGLVWDVALVSDLDWRGNYNPALEDYGLRNIYDEKLGRRHGHGWAVLECGRESQFCGRFGTIARCFVTDAVEKKGWQMPFRQVGDPRLPARNSSRQLSCAVRSAAPCPWCPRRSLLSVCRCDNTQFWACSHAACMMRYILHICFWSHVSEAKFLQSSGRQEERKAGVGFVCGPQMHTRQDIYCSGGFKRCCRWLDV